MLPDELVERARGLAGRGRRSILGIAGPPGSGKSTVAAELTGALQPHAVLVPMDGFHLADAELHRLGRHERKGAVDTFDGHGYLALLRRLRTCGPATVYAPEFRREIEEPVAGAVPVPPSVPLVITEGNYLLVDDEPWAQVKALLDEVWYLDVDEPERLRRLIGRHMAYGRDEQLAQARALGSDQRNAELIVATRERADLLVRLT